MFAKFDPIYFLIIIFHRTFLYFFIFFFIFFKVSLHISTLLEALNKKNKKYKHINCRFKTTIVIYEMRKILYFLIKMRKNLEMLFYRNYKQRKIVM